MMRHSYHGNMGKTRHYGRVSGNIPSVPGFDATGLTSNYNYDPIYELLTVVQGGNATGAYTYDKGGNRLSSTGLSPYTYNSSNELVTTPNTSYVYDLNGNMTSATDSTGTTNYAWDFENRLTSVALPGNSGTLTFEYDPFDRRIQKTLSTGSGTSTVNYLYDGSNIIEETDATGNMSGRYVQSLTDDRPLAMIRGNSTNYYQADGLGSITSLSNSAGALAQTYTFDAFGQETNSTGSANNPFRYTAREFDPESKMYYYRARYYNSSNGNFISEDPAGYFGGTNFYAYVNGNPANYRDPTGQWPVHGWWCGPNWTGGRFEQYDPNHDKNGYYKDPVNPTDAVCREHDICYYRCRATFPCDEKQRGSCMREICDARLILHAPTNGFWGPIIAAGIDFFNGHPDAGANDENCPDCAFLRSRGGKK